MRKNLLIALALLTSSASCKDTATPKLGQDAPTTPVQYSASVNPANLMVTIESSLMEQAVADYFLDNNAPFNYFWTTSCV